jgi:hypothetical protein
LGESRLDGVELDVGMKLNATEVASAELIGDTDLGVVELTGGSVRRAQRRCVDVGGAELTGNTGLSNGSARSSAAAWSLLAARRGGVGMVVTRTGQVAARVRDGEEMHKLHDIFPLPIALNGEEEKRETRWNQKG